MKLSLPKIKLPKKNLQESNIINPHKHWGILLKVFFIVVLCLIIFSLYLLYQIKNDHIFQVNPTIEENNSSIKEELLKKVNDSFDKKAQKESELKANPPSFSDPSI